MLKARSFLSSEAQEEKVHHERITESCFKVMENRIDQLEEKNHSAFNHKSSMKLVLCPRRKGRLREVQGLWDLAIPLGTFHHVRPHCSPFLPLLPQSQKSYTFFRVSFSASSSRGLSPSLAETINPFSAFVQPSVFTATLCPLHLVFTVSGGSACLPHLYTSGSHMDSDI